MGILAIVNMVIYKSMCINIMSFSIFGVVEFINVSSRKVVEDDPDVFPNSVIVSFISYPITSRNKIRKKQRMLI